MMKIADLLSKNAMRKEVYRYRVINDTTQEQFIVEGTNLEGCRLIADQKCAQLGWQISDMRSEEVE